MDFYHAYYKRQIRDETTGLWRDTCYVHQGIIVIADTDDDARLKIEKCLSEVERYETRAILNSDVTKCIGLDLRHGFDWSFEVHPIMETEN